MMFFMSLAWQSHDTDTVTHMQTDKQSGRQTDRHTNSKTGGQTDRQAEFDAIVAPLGFIFMWSNAC